MFKVKDANGRSIEFSLEDLGDSNFNPLGYQSHSVSTNVDLSNREVEILDANGDCIGMVGDVASFTDSDTNELPKAIDVEIEATHSGDNHNYAIYHSDSMEKDHVSFVHPFRKPFIKNHNLHSDPIGRIETAIFKESQIVSDRDCIGITVRVTDKDAIEKFLDGRYRTVSIGFDTGHIKCNICGKDILKDKKVKFCGHWRGEKYGDNVALWHMRDIRYKECSVVNNPADDWAQVTKIRVVSNTSGDNEGNEDNEIEKTLLDGEQDTNIINDNKNQDADKIIDSLLEGMEKEDNEDNQDSNSSENDNPENDNPENDNPNDDNQDNDKSNKDEEIERLNNLLNEKDSENESLKKSLEDSYDKISSHESKIVELESKVNDYISISKTLATQNKRLLADKLVVLEKTSTYVVDETASKECLKLSAKEITEKIDSMVEEFSKKSNDTTSIPKIGSNLIVNGKDENAVIDDEVGKKDNEYQSSDKAVMDSIINKFVK